MQQYRKLPIVIEAVQFTGLNKEEVCLFYGGDLSIEIESETAYLAGQGVPTFSILIPTLEGTMKLLKGDYLIKGIVGEFYPVKEVIFKATYEFIPAESIEQPSIRNEFVKELRRLINRYSLDSQANVPDFLLAEYLVSCLDTQKEMVKNINKYKILNPKGEIQL